MAANVTQTMYGMSNMLPSSETFRNLRIVTKIAIHSATITISPVCGDFNPKNAIDQKTFSNNCIPKVMSAGVAWMLSFRSRQTRNREMPMSMYSVIHTGENNQFGGVKEGLLSVAYHVGIASVVKMDPTKPASWQIAMLSINRQISGRRNLFISYP